MPGTFRVRNALTYCDLGGLAPNLARATRRQRRGSGVRLRLNDECPMTNDGPAGGSSVKGARVEWKRDCVLPTADCRLPTDD